MQRFSQVFDRQKLIETFGPESVNYSMDREFSEHFAHAFSRAIQKWNGKQNYFLNQVFSDEYPPDSLPLYLTKAGYEALQAGLGKDRLSLHHGDLTLFLGKPKKYHLIHTSNISDWMPVKQMDEMILSMKSILHPNGATIMRRLNGDHSLADIVSSHLTVDKKLNNMLQERDRSFFYSEVVVAFK